MSDDTAAVMRRVKKAAKILFYKRHRQPGVKGWELRKTLGKNYLNIIELLNRQLENLDFKVKIVYETGDLGDQAGIVLDYGYEFFPGFIASLSIDYSRYRFEEIYDYESQLANALRAVYKFSKHWRVDLEYQLLNNRFKESDHRVLNHIHFVW